MKHIDRTTSLFTMAPASPPETEYTTQENSPDPDLLLQRRGTLGSIYASTTSSSSPEFGEDVVRTPESDDDRSSSSAVKNEDFGETPLGDITEAKSGTVDGAIPTPRKRGRPRKHPVVDQKKAAHARSKTGCGTCSESSPTDLRTPD